MCVVIQNVEVGNEGDTSLKLLTENVKYCEDEGGDGCKDQDDCDDQEEDVAGRGCLLGPRPEGKGCFRFCDLNLCPQNVRCVDESELGHCDCGADVGGGRYCEERLRDFVCPRHWWGRPVCGPCNCDTARGFNETCHAETGECTCKDNHYFQVVSRCCFERERQVFLHACLFSPTGLQPVLLSPLRLLPQG